MGALFDSVILIDYLRGITKAADVLTANPDAAISKLTWIEVLIGCDAHEEAVAQVIFAALRIIPLTDEIAPRSIRVRRGTRLKLADGIIYATALECGLTLYTRNTRDFSEAMTGVRIPYTL